MKLAFSFDHSSCFSEFKKKHPFKLLKWFHLNNGSKLKEVK